MPKYVMITLVSGERIPNLTPIFQEGAPEYQKIYFLHTNKFGESFAPTEKVLKSRKPNLITEYYAEPVDNADWEKTREVASKLIRKIRQEYAPDKPVIVCNWTPGTKPMALGLVEAAREHGCPTVYVDTERNRLIDPHDIYSGSTLEKVLQVQLSVREYLEVQGLKIRESEYKEPNPRWVQAAAKIFETIATPSATEPDSRNIYYGKAGSFFNVVNVNKARHEKHKKDDKKSKCIDCNVLSVSYEAIRAATLADELMSFGIVEQVIPNKVTGQVKIVLPSTKELHYLQGPWLEYYVYGKLKERFAPGNLPGIDSRVAHSVPFDWPPQRAGQTDVKNELDVVFTSGTQLLLMSCKIGGAYLQGVEESSNLDPLYELQAISQKTGLFNKKALVICQPLDKLKPNFKDRANVLGIKLLGLQELADIANAV